jgi:hypothetical protein
MPDRKVAPMLLAAAATAIGFAAKAGEQLPTLNGQKPLILGHRGAADIDPSTRLPNIVSSSNWEWTRYSAILPTLQ